MITFPPDIDYPPEQLAKMAGIDYAFLQHMLRAGCPVTERGLSHNTFIQWTNERYLEALAEYDVASLPREGYFSDVEQYSTLAPVIEWELHDKGAWLAVGGPGVDGIRWAVRRSQKGLFAFYPIDGEFVFVAENGPDLISKWTSGHLHL